MLPKLAALLIATATAGAGPVAFADPPAYSGGQTHPVALTRSEGPASRPTREIWGKGQVLPAEYRRASLSHWDRYSLPPAPDGCEWVSVGQDAYIVEISSGEITGAFIGVLTD